MAGKTTEAEAKQEVLIVHRKAPWVTVIGDHKFFPGFNKIEGSEEIKKIKKSTAWESETKPNPMYQGVKNMVEVVVPEEAKESFVDTIKAMSAEDAMELINHHGDIDEVKAVLSSDKRKLVKESAKNQIENIESRNK